METQQEEPMETRDIEKGLPTAGTVKEALSRSRYPIPNFDETLPQHYLEGLKGYADSLCDTDLNNPSVSYYGRLRFYSLQHICQELNALSSKALKAANPSWHDLERLRLLLHEHGSMLIGTLLPHTLTFLSNSNQGSRLHK
jgi:hypothetical protein